MFFLTKNFKSFCFHFISINAVQDQYRNLYGLKVGDDVHFEPIHSAIKRLEEEADPIIKHKKTVGKLPDFVYLCRRFYGQKHTDFL